jgi:hypothetical protein
MMALPFRRPQTSTCSVKALHSSLFFPHDRHPDVPYDWDLTTYNSNKIRSGGEVVEHSGFKLEHDSRGSQSIVDLGDGDLGERRTL